MSKPAILRTIAQVKFRVARTEQDCRQMVEIIRQAADEPGYCGPELALFERLAADTAAVRQALRAWLLRLCGLPLDQ
jgi:hypothetical protein